MSTSDRNLFAGRFYNDMLQRFDSQGISLSDYSREFLRLSAEAWFNDPPNLPQISPYASEISPDMLYGLATECFSIAMEQHSDFFRSEAESRQRLSFPTLVHRLADVTYKHLIAMGYKDE